MSIGHTNGIRDYYQPGDTMSRRKREVYMAKLAENERRHAAGEKAEAIEPMFECPACHECETSSGFDGIGADYGRMFCLNCGVEVEPIDIAVMGRVQQGSLEFT